MAGSTRCNVIALEQSKGGVSIEEPANTAEHFSLEQGIAGRLPKIDTARRTLTALPVKQNSISKRAEMVGHTGAMALGKEAPAQQVCVFLSAADMHSWQ